MNLTNKVKLLFFNNNHFYNYSERVNLFKKYIIYEAAIIIIAGYLPISFNILSISPSIPMLVHYAVVALFIYFGYKESRDIFKNPLLLLLALTIIVTWHLPWFFDLATKNMPVWILDIFSISFSSFVVGSNLKAISSSIAIFLFALWMLGESFLCYYWIVDPTLYSRPYSIYYAEQFPLAGTIMFLVMNLVGVCVVIKILITKVFNDDQY
ncbi:DUF1404 family protein [Stygiolobus caldivivus]|uniref:DUF1404 domain-containing protein n=1 Tax=Stygiolobus caldivivus TaxID=2824673 RepID=A0A8D5ZIG7_9CREN|nr:DUF1404 family protein [Stygiolobus caldivivus]BCU69601.1 hypothetical protein KN1_08980 [Stygiolobus caldivivus]